MSLLILNEPVPLCTNTDGVVLIKDSRIPLESIISPFQDGATAEEIVSRYPTLQLSDIYMVISYYLKNAPQVDAYISQRQEIATQIRKQNEQRFDPQGIRLRLLTRKN